MKVALGCDHGGFDHKNAIRDHLLERGFDVEDFGIYENVSVDYPDIALKVGKVVSSGDCELGILVCGTGIGMSLAANKVRGIRAAAVSEVYSAKMTRIHNDANILCLGARVIGQETAKMIAEAFLSAEYEGGRHQRRVDMITEMEGI